MPIRRGHHRLAGAEGVGQRARGDLRLVQIRGEVKVRRPDELLELFEFDEAVVEDDVLVDLVLLGQPFQADPVGLAVLAHQVGMRGAQHDIDDVGELGQDFRQRLEGMFDSLVGREQAEGEQHQPAFHAELVLVEIRIDERDVRDAVGDEINLGRRRLVNLLQHLAAALGHHHQPRRAGDQFLHHAPLVRVGLAQEGVQRGDDRHAQFAQQRQHVAAGRPAENPELVLQADDVGMADVEEIRRPQIGGQVLLLDFEAHFRRILVAALEVVDRHRKALGPGLVGRHRRPQVGGEGGDAAFARQVIAEEGDLPDLRGCVHRFRTWSAFPERQSLSPGIYAGPHLQSDWNDVAISS